MIGIVLAALLSATPTGKPDAKQAEQAAQQIEAFTDADKQEALAAARIIIEKFGQANNQAAPAAAPAAQPAKQEPQGKTMADVADKALDISTKYIGQVAAVLEKAAPHVYKVMVRQQYAKAIGNVIIGLLWIPMIIIAFSVLRHYWKLIPRPEGHDCDRERCRHSSTDEATARLIVTVVLPAAACCIAGAVFIWDLSQSIQYLINPEYYAIKDLVQILLHPSTLAQ